MIKNKTLNIKIIFKIYFQTLKIFQIVVQNIKKKKQILKYISFRTIFENSSRISNYINIGLFYPPTSLILILINFHFCKIITSSKSQKQALFLRAINLLMWRGLRVLLKRLVTIPPTECRV